MTEQYIPDLQLADSSYSAESPPAVAGPNDLDPVAFVRNRLDFNPDPPQIEVLQCTAKQGILNCSRQWGKSTITAAKAVHRAYTVIAVLHRFVQLRAHQSPLLHSLHVRHVERMPLGAPYPRVVERIREIVGHGQISGDCSLAVDATGLGAPVVDLLRAARLSCDISPVNITGGDQQSRSGKTWNVPKRDLLATLQLPLEHGQLKLAPGLKLMANLIREFADFRSTSNSSGHVRLGADGSGEHDDIVIAIALACWRAQRREVFGDAPDRPFSSNNVYNSVEDYDAVLRFHTRR